jgi:hypothetical protein
LHRMIRGIQNAGLLSNCAMDEFLRLFLSTRVL